jgi:hypothetical protein
MEIRKIEIQGPPRQKVSEAPLVSWAWWHRIKIPDTREAMNRGITILGQRPDQGKTSRPFCKIIKSKRLEMWHKR